MIAFILAFSLAVAAGAEPLPIQPDLSDPTVRLETQLRVLDTMVSSGMSAQAMEMVRTIREQGVEDVRLDVVQARAMVSSGMNIEARSMLESAVKKHRRSAEAWAQLGIIYADEDALDKAEDALTRAARYAPKDADIRNNLGWILLARGHNDAALREIQAALKLNPGSARTRNNLGFALARLEKDTQALEAFRAAAVADGGGEADARYNMGVAMEQRGERDTAIVQYQMALQSRPDHSLAQAALHRLIAPEAS